MRRAELRLATTLYWRVDWRLASRSTMLAPNILDPCEVTVLHVDATPTMKRILDGQLVAAQAAVRFGGSRGRRSSARRRLDVARHAAAARDRLRVDDVVLHVARRSESRAARPAAAARSAPRSRSPRIRGSSSARVRRRCARRFPRSRSPDKTTGIHVPLDIEIPFDELGRRATALLSGEVAGKGMRVGQITAWGVGDTVVVKVGVEGRVSGSLYLLGTIGYDVQTRSVLISELRYTLESSSKMSSIKATLGAPRIRNALADATGHGRLAVGDQVERLKAQLGELLNRPIAPGRRARRAASRTFASIACSRRRRRSCCASCSTPKRASTCTSARRPSTRYLIAGRTISCWPTRMRLSGSLFHSRKLIGRGVPDRRDAAERVAAS